MADVDLTEHKIGWIGTGRMGFAIAKRLLEAGADVAAWNRTRSKAEPRPRPRDGPKRTAPWNALEHTATSAAATKSAHARLLSQ